MPMPVIQLSLFIKAPIQVCFDLSRSIDIHIESTSHTNEKAVKGRTGGLIELGETVTWEATHFGIRQQLTSMITEFDHLINSWMRWLAVLLRGFGMSIYLN
jgi:hypothetical protein